MSRLPTMDRESLSPEDQTIWDGIAANRRGGVRGPYAALMHVPKLAHQVAALQDYFTENARLPAADRELVVLATAREMGAHFAWARHEERGIEVGTRFEAIDAVRAAGGLDALTAHERLLVELAHALLRTRALPRTLYDRALAELGQTQLIETVTLVGYYSLIGVVINGFEVPPPEGVPTF